MTPNKNIHVKSTSEIWLIISEGMGHDSEATTQIYLASLETSVVDKANKMILGLLENFVKMDPR